MLKGMHILTRCQQNQHSTWHLMLACVFFFLSHEVVFFFHLFFVSFSFYCCFLFDDVLFIFF